jgi:hypothetical protein
MIRIDKRVKKKKRSEISGRDLQKPFGEFKTVNSLQDDKSEVTTIEISMKDIVTLPHDAVFCHLWSPGRK